MKRFTFLIAGTLGVVFLKPVSAMNVDQVLSRIDFHEQNSSAVRFDYRQETQFENGGPAVSGEGTVTLQKPNRVRLHQTAPEDRWTISDGKKTWIYTPEHKQAWVSKKPALALAFQGNVLPMEHVADTLRKTYDLTIISESTGTDKTVRLSAVPKDKSQDGRLELNFGNDDWIPSKTIFRSSTARVTTQISHVESNPEINQDDFRFTPPSGIDVIPF